ncbi:MAG TPA: hypothetical protein VMC61_06860, partial [Methanocella sp.]|nr:hypothetical protein [Methanocella sp.]
QKLSPAAAWEVTKKMIDRVEQCQGVITMLWHNDVFSSPFKAHWMRLYEKVLEYGSQRKAWMTGGESIYEWWQEKGPRTAFIG